MIHHGRRYCKSGASVNPKLMWEHPHMVRTIDILINPLKEEGVHLALNGDKDNLSPSEYVKKLHKTIDDRWGDSEDSTITDSQLEQLKIIKHQVIIYTYMTYLLNSILNNGNYMSKACNEAENKDNINLLSSFAKEKS